MKKVDKLWGWELWIENNEKYCGKKIFNNGKWSSKGNFHYHPIKDETFYILEGKLQLDVGLDNGWINTTILSKNQKLRLKPNLIHRFRALEGNCTFIEFSTKHMEEDSIRCYFDEEKKKWIDVKVKE
jgi:mannose-6-phosphate isomerase-like protein (cupin superfamily)